VAAVPVEVTFSVQGVGQLLVQSAQAKDLPMIQCLALVVALIVMVVNLLTDVAYFVIDPRISVRGRRS